MDTGIKNCSSGKVLVVKHEDDAENRHSTFGEIYQELLRKFVIGVCRREFVA